MLTLIQGTVLPFVQMAGFRTTTSVFRLAQQEAHLYQQSPIAANPRVQNLHTTKADPVSKPVLLVT